MQKRQLQKPKEKTAKSDVIGFERKKTSKSVLGWCRLSDDDHLVNDLPVLALAD